MSARAVRSATQSLLSIVLGLEAALVFFVALTLFGLDVLSPLVALLGGLAAIVVLMATAAVVGRQWGLWVGWVLQLGMLALGLLLPALYIAGGIFVGIWIYCFIKGRQLDRGRARIMNENREE